MGRPSLATRTPPALRRWPLVGVLAALAVAAQLWGLYRVTGSPSPPWFPYADKVQHLVGFALPVLLVLLAGELRAAEHGRRLGRAVVGAVVGLFTVHAVVSELVQGACYASRAGDPLDVLADVVGVALGLAAFGLVSGGARDRA